VAETLQLRIAGPDALILYLGDSMDAQTNVAVQAAAAAIEARLGDELVDIVPSYASVLIIYDPLRAGHVSVARRVRAALAGLDTAAHAAGALVTLPVYYAAESGADLEALAARAGLSPDEVIALHSGREYRVYAIGFAPGFAYLGEVDARIAAPRLATPRAKVPRGAVAIAGRQTAVYPAPSPGGWNLLGLCPRRMFDPQAQPCMPVAVGDRVRFEPVDRDTFLELGGELP